MKSARGRARRPKLTDEDRFEIATVGRYDMRDYSLELAQQILAVHYGRAGGVSVDTGEGRLVVVRRGGLAIVSTPTWPIPGHRQRTFTTKVPWEVALRAAVDRAHPTPAREGLDYVRWRAATRDLAGALRAVLEKASEGAPRARHRC